jgi:hypothetical protein
VRMEALAVGSAAVSSGGAAYTAAAFGPDEGSRQMSGKSDLQGPPMKRSASGRVEEHNFIGGGKLTERKDCLASQTQKGARQVGGFREGGERAQEGH